MFFIIRAYHTTPVMYRYAPCLLRKCIKGVYLKLHFIEMNGQTSSIINNFVHT